jgi:hypothetical protein
MRPGRAAAALVLAILPAVAAGQTPEPPRPIVWDVARAVLIDPTTYAPALVAHEAMTRDWKTSQVLFANGWVERNPRFTVSGLPNDAPIGYDEGTRIIHRESLRLLQYSAINNAASGIAERLLIARYPSRRKLIRTLGWIERIGYASFVTYRNAADHLRQAGENRRLARRYGLSR